MIMASLNPSISRHRMCVGTAESGTTRNESGYWASLRPCVSQRLYRYT